MNIDSLKLLLEVSRLGSFAAAARKFDLDPSSVSRTIAALEQQLNLRLFQRSTRRLELTEAGEVYLKRITPLLEEFGHALNEAQKVSSEPNGNLRITTSVAFGQICLLPHIAEFKHLYPGIRLELQLTDTVVDLVAEGIDLACRLAPRTHTELVGRRLFDTHYHVCASPDYIKSMPKLSHPCDLKDHQCLVFTLPDYRSRWAFKDSTGKKVSVEISSNISISSVLALRECTLSGMGPALLADWLIERDLENGSLVCLLNDYKVSAEGFDTAVWLLYPSRHFLPVKTRAMVDFLSAKY